jgi:hypothetical protein
MDYLIPKSFLTLEFGREAHLAELGFDRGRGFKYHYQRSLPKLHKIAEGLILGRVVTVGVVGPNVQLPLLTEYFKSKALLKLLDVGALEFKQITGGVSLATNMNTKKAYLSPETAYRGPENSDPEAAAHKGLEIFPLGLSDAEQRELTKQVAQHTNLTREAIAQDTIDIAREKFAEFQWAFDTPAIGAEEARIEKIRGEVRDWAMSYCRSSAIYDDSFCLLNEKDTWTSVFEAAQACAAHVPVSEVSEEVLVKDDVLSLAEMLSRGVLLPQDVPELWGKPATEAFRTWLWSEVTDGRDAATDWLEVQKINLDERWLKKSAICVLALVKSLVTTAIKQATGAPEGASIPIEVGSDIVIDNAFDWVLTGLEKRSPKNFVDSLAMVVGRRAIRRPETD